jgi:hypothetical protein
VKKLEAKILLAYESEEIANAIANAVSPDNFKTPKGLTVNTVYKGVNVITKVICEGKFQTFISTIDDLLFCVSVAERSLRIVRKKR